MEEGAKAMPTNRVRRSRGRTSADGITENDYYYFTWILLDGMDDGYKARRTEAEHREFWKEHREAIMARYLEEIKSKGPGWYGCRPWPFFKWDVTEPRLPADITLASNELYDPKKVGSDGLEADFAYLKRLGLLEEWELEI
jgi:hypothetical protein